MENLWSSCVPTFFVIWKAYSHHRVSCIVKNWLIKYVSKTWHKHSVLCGKLLISSSFMYRGKLTILIYTIIYLSNHPHWEVVVFSIRGGALGYQHLGCTLAPYRNASFFKSIIFKRYPPYSLKAIAKSHHELEPSLLIFFISLILYYYTFSNQ